MKKERNSLENLDNQKIIKKLEKILKIFLSPILSYGYA